MFNCSDAAGQFLLRFRPGETNVINAGRISTQHDYIRKASWTGKGTAYAYLTNDLAGCAFCIKSDRDESPLVVPWHGGAGSYTLNGDQLFFAGNPDNQAPSIWNYDLKSQSFKCIVESSDGPLNKRIGKPPISDSMTNSLGEQRFCHVWVPPNFSPSKKYPILLAQELNTWFPYFQIAANNGFYVAVVDRPYFHTWNGRHERTWTEDITELRKIMARNPNIDTNRIYLYACSAETYFLSPLFSSNSELWKGAVLFTPIGLPEPRALQGKRILIVDGKIDGDANTRLPKYQDQVAQEGGEMTLFIQDNADHNAASAVTEKTRAREFGRFVAEGN